jgi:hypothetical protein
MVDGLLGVLPGLDTGMAAVRKGSGQAVPRAAGSDGYFNLEAIFRARLALDLTTADRHATLWFEWRQAYRGKFQLVRRGPPPRWTGYRVLPRVRRPVRR